MSAFEPHGVLLHPLKLVCTGIIAFFLLRDSDPTPAMLTKANVLTNVSRFYGPVSWTVYVITSLMAIAKEIPILNHHVVQHPEQSLCDTCPQENKWDWDLVFASLYSAFSAIDLIHCCHRVLSGDDSAQALHALSVAAVATHVGFAIALIPIIIPTLFRPEADGSKSRWFTMSAYRLSCKNECSQIIQRHWRRSITRGLMFIATSLSILVFSFTVTHGRHPLAQPSMDSFFNFRGPFVPTFPFKAFVGHEVVSYFDIFYPRLLWAIPLALCVTAVVAGVKPLHTRQDYVETLLASAVQSAFATLVPLATVIMLSIQLPFHLYSPRLLGPSVVPLLFVPRSTFFPYSNISIFSADQIAVLILFIGISSPRLSQFLQERQRSPFEAKNQMDSM